MISRLRHREGYSVDNIPDNWLSDYYSRADETEHCTENMTVNDHGFLSWEAKEDHLAVYDCYGDGKHWQSEIERIAKEHGLDTIRMATKRNPAAYERKYGYKVIACMMEKKI